MSLDARLSQLVREALEPMLTDRLDRLETRLTESVAAVVEALPVEPAGPRPLLTQRQVAEQLQVDPKTIRRLTQAGDFPAPIAVSPNCLRWRQEDIDTWLEARRQ